MWLISIFFKKSYFPLCNYTFTKSIWWKNKSYENFKVLKKKKILIAKEMIFLLNHLASFFIH